MKKILTIALLSICTSRIFAKWAEQDRNYTKPKPTAPSEWDDQNYDYTKPRPTPSKWADQDHDYTKPKPTVPSSSESWESFVSKESKESDSYTLKLDLHGDIRTKFAITAALQHQASNMICSPLSAMLPLGKLALGAASGSQSRKELLQAVGVTRKSKLKRKMKSLIKKLKHLPGVKLDIASRIYVDKRNKLSSKFQSEAQNVFHSSVEKVNFKNPSEVAKHINHWVGRETNGMIRKLVSSNDISSSASMVLVNAVYFSGIWSESFDKVETGTFQTPVSVSRIPMMSITSHFRYYKSSALASQIISIPYREKKASFVIVYPESRESLPELLSALKLAPELLKNAMEKMRSTKVHLTMPKFKVESELDLIHLYKKVGINTIFSRRSGLTKIVKNGTLYVSKAVQKAIIEVTEHGTKAAAASGMELVKIKYERPWELTVAHPFLYYIIAGNEQLFSGVIFSPTLDGHNKNHRPWSFERPDVGAARPNKRKSKKSAKHSKNKYEDFKKRHTDNTGDDNDVKDSNND